MFDWHAAFENADFPHDVPIINQHKLAVKRSLRNHGVPDRLLNGIETRALRSGRRQTGEFQSNRQARWTLDPNDPQYGNERDCKIIVVRLFGMLLAFEDPPNIDDDERDIIKRHYIGAPLQPGTYKDSLLLESMSYPDFAAEAAAPTHGTSNFHIGHEDPTIHPKHIPENIMWRSHRSNLIQGNMTLRQARIYIIKLIGRYFELGELNIE